MGEAPSEFNSFFKFWKNFILIWNKSVFLSYFQNFWHIFGQILAHKSINHDAILAFNWKSVCSYPNTERAQQHAAACSDSCCCWLFFHFVPLGAIVCSAYSVLNPAYFGAGHSFIRDRNPRLNASRDIYPRVISASTSRPSVLRQAWVSLHLCSPLVRCEILFRVPNFPACVGWQSWRIWTSDPLSIFSWESAAVSSQRSAHLFPGALRPAAFENTSERCYTPFVHVGYSQQGRIPQSIRC